MTSVQPSRFRATRLPGDEEGFALIEVLVAIVLLTVGVMATFTTLNVATRATYFAERNQVAVNVAQREMEAVRALDYRNLALSSTPAAVADPYDPRSRVSGGNFDVDKTSGTDATEMAVDTTSDPNGGTIGKVVPGPEAFTSGTVTGNVFRFVVWRNDANCSELLCPGVRDFKRVVVAVKLNGVAAAPNRLRGYVEVQSDFIDPDSGLP